MSASPSDLVLCGMIVPEGTAWSKRQTAPRSCPPGRPRPAGAVPVLAVVEALVDALADARRVPQRLGAVVLRAVAQAAQRLADGTGPVERSLSSHAQPVLCARTAARAETPARRASSRRVVTSCSRLASSARARQSPTTSMPADVLLGQLSTLERHGAGFTPCSCSRRRARSASVRSSRSKTTSGCGSGSGSRSRRAAASARAGARAPRGAGARAPPARARARAAPPWSCGRARAAPEAGDGAAEARRQRALLGRSASVAVIGPTKPSRSAKRLGVVRVRRPRLRHPLLRASRRWRLLARVAAGRAASGPRAVAARAVQVPARRAGATACARVAALAVPVREPAALAGGGAAVEPPALARS